MPENKIIGIVSPPYSHGGSSTFGKGNNKWFKEWREMNKRDNEQAGSKAIWDGYGKTEGQIANLPDMVAIVSPPYEEAVDGGGIFKKGYIGNHSYSKNPDTVGNRTYSNKTHNFSEGQIGSLKSNSKEELDLNITQYHKCKGNLCWYGCYEGDAHYKQYFEPSTYAHTAKISPLLAERIFKHLEQLGLLKEGMTILDFMAGSGRVPLLASLRGYNSVGVELENHFVKMCNDNKKFAENKIGRKLDMKIIQGDSRQLSKLLKSSDVGIISPPFETQLQYTSNKYNPEKYAPFFKGRIRFNQETGEPIKYGSSEGNIGNLPYKDVVGVVSPPYLEPQNPNRQGGINKHKSDCECNFCKKNKNNVGNVQGYKDVIAVVSPPYQDSKIVQLKAGMGKDMGEHPVELNEMFKTEGYSQNPQNIGNLKDKEFVGITSPPYQKMMHSEKREIPEEYLKEWRISSDKNAQPVMRNKYSDSKENIGNLKDTSFVGITSPPYKQSEVFQDKSFITKINEKTPKRMSEFNSAHGNYAESQNNLGNQQGENYLSAMLQVYKEASKVCPIICTITKNPTRQGKLRRLDLDTIKLLELSGYKIIDYHRAVLFKTFEQQTLTGRPTIKEYKGRLSFFKRLSLAKGNLASFFEDIIIGVKWATNPF